jgi:microcystin degradation protein MlrC
MKVLIGQFKQESNSFSPIQCNIEMFKKMILLHGKAGIKNYKATSNKIDEIEAFLKVLKKNKVEVIPSIFACSVSSGPVNEEAYQEIESTIIDDIKVNWPLDGILLCLHGATILTSDNDGVGRLLKRIRKEVGDKVIIAGTLDFHANITVKMVSSADILIGYHTYPHIDQYEVGYQAATLLVDAIKGKINPVIAMSKLPMIHQAEACKTDQYPFKKIMDKVRKLESKKGILSASVFQMQPWMDLENAGASVIVIADGSKQTAGKFAELLAKEYWDIRKELVFQLTPLEVAVRRAIEIEKGPVVISDSADAPSAGAPGDSPFVLSYLLTNNIDINALLTIVDADAVQKAIDLGVGKEGVFSLGGKIGKKYKFVQISGTVQYIGNGEFSLNRSSGSKIKQNMGKVAVIKIGNISVVVMENSTPISSPSLFRSVGLEPKDAKLVMVKSPLQFRDEFEDIAKEIYVVDTPGPSSSNIKSMPFKNLIRPIYPFDDEASCDTRVKSFGHVRGEKTDE